MIYARALKCELLSCLLPRFKSFCVFLGLTYIFVLSVFGYVIAIGSVCCLIIAILRRWLLRQRETESTSIVLFCIVSIYTAMQEHKNS